MTIWCDGYGRTIGHSDDTPVITAQRVSGAYLGLHTHYRVHYLSLQVHCQGLADWWGHGLADSWCPIMAGP